MHHVRSETKRRSVDGRAGRREAANAQFFINKQINAEFLDIDKHVGWNDKMVIDRVICKRTEEGWTLMIKAPRHGRRKIAYVNARTLAEAFELAGEFAARGCLSWVDDRWPPKIFGKRKP